MAARFELRDGIDEALATSVVRAGINSRADGIAPRVTAIASAVGARRFAAGVRRVNGVRPGAKAVGHHRRPFARVEVVAEGAEAVEYGDRGVTRQSILARAIGGS